MPGSRESYVIAVDAGGTHTRVACLGLDGTVLGTARGGGGSPTHNDDAREQVTRTMVAALASARVDAADAVALTAGMAGIDRPDDTAWARTFFALPRLDCPLELVNDAVIAHAGAFAGAPGVMVVAGTGSTILAITPHGEQISNARYQHYAGGARHLVFDVMGRVLSGQAGDDDLDFLAVLLAAWDAADLDHLRRRVLELDAVDPQVVKRRYGDLAPVVTTWADRAPVAGAALDRLVGVTATGVRLLAPHVGTDPVGVAVTGSLAESRAFRGRLARVLDADPGPIAGRSALVPARLGPVGGAAIRALTTCGVDVDDAVLARVAASRS